MRRRRRRRREGGWQDKGSVLVLISDEGSMALYVWIVAIGHTCIKGAPHPCCYPYVQPQEGNVHKLHHWGMGGGGFFGLSDKARPYPNNYIDANLPRKVTRRLGSGEERGGEGGLGKGSNIGDVICEGSL